MANFNGENYQGAFVTKPHEKVPKGENTGKRRTLIERFTLSSALGAGDRILGLKIPASSMVLDAKIKISKSLGATGIFDLGYLANGEDAEDVDAFVKSADAGGQAVLKRADVSSVGIFKRFSKETQMVAICTEIMDGAVLDGVITMEITYVND